MSNQTLTRRRWLVFSLRSMLVVTGFICTALAVARHCIQLRNLRRKVEADLEAKGGAVFRVSDTSDAMDVMASILAKHGTPETLQQPRKPFPISWIRRLFGDEPAYCVIVWQGSLTDQEDQAIVDAFPEAIIWRVAPDS